MINSWNKQAIPNLINGVNSIVKVCEEVFRVKTDERWTLARQMQPTYHPHLNLVVVTAPNRPRTIMAISHNKILHCIQMRLSGPSFLRLQAFAILCQECKCS